MDASGLQSIFCRTQWDKAKTDQLKQRLTTYNREDCMALQTIIKTCDNIDKDTPSAQASCLTKRTDEIKADKPLGIFKRNKFIFSELDEINKKAYWDYQRDKIYLRTSSTVRSKNKKMTPRIKSVYRINRKVISDRLKRCPKCNARKPMTHNHHTRVVYDLKMFDGGIKRFVSRCDYTRYMCKKCKKTFMPPLNNDFQYSKYGSSLVAWTVYQSIGRLKSQNSIIDDLSEIFDYQLSPSMVARFKERTANNYKNLNESLLNKILDGALIHIDETKISIKGINGYVWAITNMETVVYIYNSSREAGMIRGKLI